MLYKVLGPNRMPHHGGSGQWKPVRRWMPKIDNIALCERGYHLVSRDQLVGWLGPVIYEAEGRGGYIEDNDKSVWAEARLLQKIETWNDRTARLFAADCAEHVLQLFERGRPNDDRPRKAIESARAFVRGEIDDAAWAAARDTARDAAQAAAWAAARDTARAAARDTAWAAAWAAARDTAWAAERGWQTERLFAYLGGSRCDVLVGD